MCNNVALEAGPLAGLQKLVSTQNEVAAEMATALSKET